MLLSVEGGTTSSYAALNNFRHLPSRASRVLSLTIVGRSDTGQHARVVPRPTASVPRP